MKNKQRFFASSLICIPSLSLSPLSASPRQDSATKAAVSSAQRDGSHDFDRLLGSWKYYLRRRLNPLTGSDKWVDFEGTGVCRTIYDGAQIDQLFAKGPTGQIEGLTLRTYNPDSHQWRLYWANKKAGVLDRRKSANSKMASESFSPSTQSTTKPSSSASAGPT